MLPRRTLPLSAIVAASLAIAACGGDRKQSEDAVSAGADSMAAAATRAADSAKAATPALTDANIVAILDNANVADSSAGAIAAKKATNADVRAFGQMMMRDHHALRKQGQDLAKKLGVTPELPAGDTSAAQANTWNERLNSMAKGADWDKAYIDHEVTYHQAVLQTATTALNAAQNAELKELIQKATPNIQAHLAKAQELQSRLGGATTASTSGAGSAGTGH